MGVCSQTYTKPTTSAQQARLSAEKKDGELIDKRKDEQVTKSNTHKGSARTGSARSR